MFRFLILLPVFSISGIALFPLIYRSLPQSLFNGIVLYLGLLAALLIFVFTFASACLLLIKKSSSAISDSALSLSLLTSSFIAAAFNICFLVVFPVTFDRSVSTYLLEQIHQRKTIRVSELQDLFIKDYVLKREAVARRVEEQRVTGNISISGDESSPESSVHLTAQGKKFLQFEEMVKKIFNLKDRSISASNE